MKPYQIANKRRRDFGNYPDCECPDRIPESIVVDSRTIYKNGMIMIRRRRKCRVCGGRFTTYELDCNDLAF